MIELHLAPSWANPLLYDFSDFALPIWSELQRKCPEVADAVQSHDLDIIMSAIDRRYGSSLGAVNRIALGEAFGRARACAASLPAKRPKWITLAGHHSEVAPRQSGPFDFACLGPEAVGALSLFEGGARFLRRDGSIIESEDWPSAGHYFMELLRAG